MASGSFKDTARSLKAAFTTPDSPRSLPPDIQHAIHAFFEKHDPLEENDVRRVQEELQNIYTGHVQKDTAKRAAFLHALQLLRPALLGISRLEEWWKLLVKPAIDGVGCQRDEIGYATSFILTVLDHEEEEGRRAEESAHFMKLLLEAYLKRVKAYAGNKELPTPQDSYIARRIEEILITSGRRRPKDLLLAIDALMMDRHYRLKSLELLCSFVRFQPPHLHRVSETSLIVHLLKCLMIDTSTTVLSLALNSLIMFLPHIPSSARSHLPRLFLVYSRLLCWEQFRPVASNIVLDGVDESLPLQPNGEADTAEDDSWQKLTSSYDTTESTIPDLLYYFTFLYGLYPLNFTSYIRKPRKYLKNINFPRAEEFDLDQDLIRQRTIPYQQQHKLHRNFFQTTLEDELEDNQWLTMDPAEVMSECMGLCITHDPSFADGLPLHSPFDGPNAATSISGFPSHQIPTEQIPPQLLAETGDIPADAWNESRSPTAASPTLHPYPVIPPQKRLEIKRNGSVASYHSVSDTPSVVGIPAAERKHLLRSPALRPAPQHEATLAYLQRELALLRNELNFERYLKQQHLTHIGVLQRRQIEESNRASDLQNLVNTNKVLKAKVIKAEEQLQSMKKETQVRRTQAKRLETDLSSRVRALRESERQWLVDGEQLRGDLERAHTDCDQLRSLVVQAESRELLSRQQMASMKLQIEHMDGLKKQVVDLQEKVRDYEARELQFEQATAERNRLATELSKAELRLQSRDLSSDERDAYLKRIANLDAQLAVAHVSQDPDKVQKLVDRAVSGLQNKYASLKTEYISLKQRIVELELHCSELAHDLALANGGFHPIETQHQSQSQHDHSLGLTYTSSAGTSDAISPTALSSPIRPSTAPSQEPVSPALLSNPFARIDSLNSRFSNNKAFSPSPDENDRMRSVTPSSNASAKSAEKDGKRDGSPRTVRKFRGLRGIM